jgi:hypothetical protein
MCLLKLLNKNHRQKIINLRYNAIVIFEIFSSANFPDGETQNAVSQPDNLNKGQ